MVKVSMLRQSETLPSRQESIEVVVPVYNEHPDASLSSALRLFAGPSYEIS